MRLGRSSHRLASAGPAGFPPGGRFRSCSRPWPSVVFRPGLPGCSGFGVSLPGSGPPCPSVLRSRVRSGVVARLASSRARSFRGRSPSGAPGSGPLSGAPGSRGCRRPRVVAPSSASPPRAVSSASSPLPPRRRRLRRRSLPLRRPGRLPSLRRRHGRCRSLRRLPAAAGRGRRRPCRPGVGWRALPRPTRSGPGARSGCLPRPACAGASCVHRSHSAQCCHGRSSRGIPCRPTC